MSNKFEKLLDYLVNEEMDKANELFHEIVVEKSRSIYENLIAEEAKEDEEDDESMHESSEEDEEDDESMHESSEEDEEDESVEEGLYDEEESMMEIGGDASDDFVDNVVDHGAMDDAGDPSMDGDMGDDMGMGNEPATKDDVQDVKDALDQLTAEFEAMLAGTTQKDVEFDDEGEDDMDFGSDDSSNDYEDDEDDDEDYEEDDEEDDESAAESFVREYREVVAKSYPFGKNSEEGAHTKSSINANPSDRPTTKASAKNIAQGGGKGEGKMDGTSPAAGSKGLAGGVKGKFTDGSTLNVDGKQTKGYNTSAKKPAKGESGVNDKNVLPK